MPRRTLALSLLLSGAACDAPPPAATPNLAEPPPAETPDLQERLATIAAIKQRHDALARDYASGALADRLVTGGNLLVDPHAAGVEQVTYLLFRGALADPPTDLAALSASHGGDGQPPMRIVHGGVDVPRPAIFDGVTAGPHTVCVALGPALDPEKERAILEVAAEFEAKPDAKLSPEALAAMNAAVEAKIGRAVRPTAAPNPARCLTVDVAADPASRIVDLPAPAPPSSLPAPADPAPAAPEERPLTAFAGWKVKSARWSDGAALTLPSAVVRAVAPCLRTVKTPEAEVVITVARDAVTRVDVRKNPLKCVEELPGVEAPGLGRDGELTAIFARKG